ncbi:MAG: Gfo/Idh/MocA family oxidoreductase [Planctomycetota bacterium]
MGISIGLVGLGSFGSSFAGLFKKHPLVDRVALCDREPDRVDRFADAPWFQDKFDPSDAYETLDDICRADLDALAIITQPWLHAPQCVQAMESGKHVYSAVPIITLPDGDEILDWCDRIVETCRRTGRHYMLGETTYYRPGTMFCRRKAADGAFGRFVHAEGEYLHDFESPSCNLKDVQRSRTASASGREWLEQAKQYAARGAVGGPMHYPTHSVSGPMSVMNAHAVKVCAWGSYNEDGDPFFGGGPSDETALFRLSNGATLLLREHREIGHPGHEGFDLYGTQACFRNEMWFDKEGGRTIPVEEMRDPLPDEVAAAWRDASTESVAYGGHGGSHAYLVHEFVDAVANDRVPAISAWAAVRYMAAGVMAHKSVLRDGEVLDVPDWGDPPA